MLLKQKRMGKIKARGCVDGRPQHEYIEKNKASSPTISIYVLFVSCVINTIKGREDVTSMVHSYNQIGLRTSLLI